VGLRKLGELLLAEGAITEAQLAAAIEEQGATGERLGEILLARRNVSRLELANAFAEQHADKRSRPGAGSGSAETSSGAELRTRLADVEALAARLAQINDDLAERLSALEALIPAISDALVSPPR